jgi:hypothetical protein
LKCSTLENTITKKKKTTKKNIAKNKNNGKPKQNNNNTNKNGQQSQIRRLLAWGTLACSGHDIAEQLLRLR